MSKLQGRIALVTGASSGIGLASAKLFAREGARVYVTGRDETKLRSAVAEIGESARGVRADVSSLSDLERLFAVVREEAGAIDVLFANAGGGDMLPLGSITEAQFDRIFSTNVKGLLFTVQMALPLMRTGGSIILAGSTAAVTGIPGFSVYSASKAAVRAFARGWILDVAPRGLRINVLAPGATLTPGWRGLASSDDAHALMIAETRAATPLGRLGDPAETAAAALFLASDESSFVNGSELFVDGGAAQI